MKKLRALLLASLSLLLSRYAFSFSEDAELTQSQTLRTLSQEIHSCADDLRQQSIRLTEQLAIAENELSLSSKTVERLQAERNDWITSSVAMNEKLSALSTKCVEAETKLKTAWKIIWILIGVLLAGIAGFVTLSILELKKITDIL